MFTASKHSFVGLCLAFATSNGQPACKTACCWNWCIFSLLFRFYTL